MEETIVYFMDVGFSDQEIPRIITRFPQVLSLSLEKNIQPKCEFYMDHISETLSPLVHTPSVLGLSLDKRCAGLAPPLPLPPPSATCPL